ncbi:MAG: 5'-nucleotidase, partial [Candidatus Cloacimonetes bacterium]|nr:5'-nucleotidase [Candidatus Cloacimonadota bacterium]
NIGHLTLKIDKETKTVSGYEMPSLRNGLLVTLFEDEWIPEQAIADTILIMQKLAEKGMDEVIGYSNTYLSKNSRDAQNAIGNMVCDAMRIQTTADFSFLNLGGVRSEINKGPITYRNVFDVMPFDNQVIVMEIDGKFLKEIIEMRVSGSRHGLLVSGVEVVYSRKRESYDRITHLEIGGKPWQADKIYRVATTDFLLQGNAGLTMLTKVPESQVTRYELDLRDVIVDYIKTNSPLNTEIDNRWKKNDSSKLSEPLMKELKREIN